jgi:hypothetical protein
MGTMIGVRSNINRVAEHVRTALRNAQARGEGIGEAGRARLEQAVAAMDAKRQASEAATRAEAVTWAAVVAEDARSDAAIGSVRDEMWNALGRPRRSPALEDVFPDGVKTYTAGDRRQQPLTMQVLVSRILEAGSLRWPKEQREAWAGEIETRRQEYHRLVDAHRPNEAMAMVARNAYRATVRTALQRLREFKRDLQNLGMDSVEIDTIIPPGPPRNPEPQPEVKQAA